MLNQQLNATSCLWSRKEGGVHRRQGVGRWRRVFGSSHGTLHVSSGPLSEQNGTNCFRAQAVRISPRGSQRPPAYIAPFSRDLRPSI